MTIYTLLLDGESHSGVCMRPILLQTLPSNLEASGGPCGSILTLFLSIDFQLDTSNEIDLANLTVLLSFSETDQELPGLYLWDNCFAQKNTHILEPLVS